MWSNYYSFWIIDNDLLIYAKKSNYRNVVAPPTFLRSINTNPLPENIISPYSAVVDGGSVWEYFEPVCAGDVITTLFGPFRRVQVCK